MIRIANVVGTGNLEVELDVEAVQSDLDVPFTEYDPLNYHGLYVRLEESGPLITVFRSGKYNISGCASIEELEETNQAFLVLLGKMDILDSTKDIGFSVQNIVSIGELPEKVDLNTIAIGLGLEVTEYEPEQFPGLVYRPDELHAVMLVFSSGKVVITGTSDIRTAEEAFDYLNSQVSAIL